MLEQLQAALDNGNHQEAQVLIGAISDQQDSPHAQISLVNICLKQGFFDLGVRCFAKAANLESVALQAIALAQEPAMQQNTELAIAFLHSAHIAQPKNLAILVSLADMLLASNQSDKVEVILREALTTLPHAEIVARLAEAYFRQGKFHDAKACAVLGLEMSSNNPQSHINLAVIEKSLNNLPQSARQFSHALELAPDNFFAHINLAHLSLMSGEFALGWSENEWRWRDPVCNREQFPLPLWQREQEPTHHLLLWADQGLGDQIMFLSLYQRLHCQVTVKVDPRLHPLLPAGMQVLTQSYDGDYTEFDSQISLGSLPSHFITSFEDFSPVPSYLQPPATDGAAPQAEPGSQYTKRMGFSWRGGRYGTGGGHRSLDMDVWSLLKTAPEVQWVNLQYDSTETERAWLQEQGIETPEFDLKNDLVASAQLLTELDGYIGVDNSTLHLAAALGVNATLLLPTVADWRWFTEIKHCYWYKTVTLNRALPVNLAEAEDSARFMAIINGCIEAL
ncbi:hypothetical protein [Halioxenophilus aromaticivorans]|uniref:Uncharacterized protein n=1 Tax=Halioxenophilus aromaticivorans TaxID=1306992 RepID=A0AAV3TZL3_9ALTE